MVTGSSSLIAVFFQSSILAIPSLYCMKSILCSLILLVSIFGIPQDANNLIDSTHSQVHVYPEDDVFYHEMLLNVDNGYVCPGNRSNWSDALVTVSNEQIFKGFSNSPFDVLYTLKDNKLYVGDSQFSSDVKFTFKDGKIYKGDSDYLLDQLFTYDRGRLYKGTVISVFDIVITIEGSPTIAELFAIMLVLEMI